MKKVNIKLLKELKGENASYPDLASACLLLSRAGSFKLKNQINENSRINESTGMIQQALIFLKQSEFRGRHTDLL